MEEIQLDTLKPNPKNPRTLSKHDGESLAKSMKEFGDLSAIVFNEQTKQLVGGHQRVEIIKRIFNGAKVVITQRFEQADATGTVAIGYVVYDGRQFPYRAVNWPLDRELAANIAANRIQGTFDLDLLAEVNYMIKESNEDLLALTGQTEDEINKLLNSVSGEEQEPHGSLTDKFIVPPFSILDSRQGYWQERARAWGDKIGSVSATREGTLGLTSLAGDKYGGKAFAASGVSELDPVLCEVVYRWFTPRAGAHVFNPFGGEPVSAFVAADLGFKYSGTEIRQEQVTETYNKLNLLTEEQKALVDLRVGDARTCGTIFGEVKTDLIFSSPPFYDLEVYSDGAQDMSNLPTYAEFMDSYKQAFTSAVGMLNNNSFVCINVTEIRDKNGVYRNFVGDNVKLFTELGLHFYNDIILVNAVGTAAIRAARSMNNRKVVRVHQNLLIFYKGDVKDIGKYYPALEIDMPAEYDEGASDAELPA